MVSLNPMDYRLPQLLGGRLFGSDTRIYAFGHDLGDDFSKAAIIVLEQGDDHFLVYNEGGDLARGVLCSFDDDKRKASMKLNGQIHYVQFVELIPADEPAPDDAEPLPEYLRYRLPTHHPDDLKNPRVVPIPIHEAVKDPKGERCRECGERNPERALRCVECNAYVDERVRKLRAE